MPIAGPYRVLDRGNRRIVHESFAEGPKKATALAKLAESCGETDWAFCFQIVDRKTGRILAESSPMDCDQISEEIYAANAMIPASHHVLHTPPSR